MLSSFILSAIIFLTSFPAWAEKPIVIGSKRFTENYIIAEIFSQILEDRGFRVKRKFGMGGTMVAYNALKAEEIDIYPEYSGTISLAILKSGERRYEKINELLKADNLTMLKPLGFDNSYCTVMKRQRAEKLHITTISDLSQHPELRGAFSFEFQERRDGWPAMRQVYNLENQILGIEVPLTYEALKDDRVDFAEAYSTEPLIAKNDFVVLEDDKGFFPKYSAVPLVRKNFSENIKATLETLAGRIDSSTIIDLSSQAVNGVPIPEVANLFLIRNNLIKESSRKKHSRGMDWTKLWNRTQTHMYLTLLAVLLACLVAVPLATWIVPYKKLSRIILGFAGILQTIPSIALLTFMIPFFGIGFLPAIIGLFIYSLLPILQNTYVAMSTIDPKLITAAQGIGLYPREVLFSVKLPLAFPTILAGLRTATILNIGTATLAAFIGAGGLGEPIVTGLALNDNYLVLQGAIPAAALAILMDGLFSLINSKFSKKV
jgi:osmoprotectant transport system permease protein